jgi:carbon storage regulator
MLVITRKKGEAILIGEDIEVVVVKTEDGAVKLAINAPKNVTILRKELYKEVTDENINSASNQDSSILKDFKR